MGIMGWGLVLCAGVFGLLGIGLVFSFSRIIG
jgi:hypothetical protein